MTKNTNHKTAFSVKCRLPAIFLLLFMGSVLPYTQHFQAEIPFAKAYELSEERDCESETKNPQPNSEIDYYHKSSEFDSRQLISAEYLRHHEGLFFYGAAHTDIVTPPPEHNA